MKADDIYNYIEGLEYQIEILQMKLESEIESKKYFKEMYEQLRKNLIDGE